MSSRLDIAQHDLAPLSLFEEAFMQRTFIGGDQVLDREACRAQRP